MVKTLQKAIAEVASLPDSDQEEIGRKLLSHVEKLRKLRADIDAGIRSLDEGKGKAQALHSNAHQAMNRDNGRT